MIKAEQIREILSQYEKHGWKLSRVLLCDETREHLEISLEEIFGNAKISASEVDAAWFTRPSKNERMAWELRLLSENPFALFETFEKDLDKDSRNRIKKEMETRLLEYASRLKT